MDWDRLARLLRVEQWLGDDDGLQQGPNNYRVYFEPGRPMVVHRWDTDASFPGAVQEDAAAAVDFDASNWEQDDGSSLSRSCHADAACRQRWSEQKSVGAGALSDGRLLALGEQLHALVEEGVLGDPRRYCGEEEDTVSDEAILAYLASGELAAKGDCPVPPGADAPGVQHFMSCSGPLAGATPRATEPTTIFSPLF